MHMHMKYTKPVKILEKVWNSEIKWMVRVIYYDESVAYRLYVSM